MAFEKYLRSFMQSCCTRDMGFFGRLDPSLLSFGVHVQALWRSSQSFMTYMLPLQLPFLSDFLRIGILEPLRMSSVFWLPMKMVNALDDVPRSILTCPFNMMFPVALCKQRWLLALLRRLPGIIMRVGSPSVVLV